MQGLVSRFRAANSYISSKITAPKITGFFLATALAATGMTAMAQEQDNSHIRMAAKTVATAKSDAPAKVETNDPADDELLNKRIIRLVGEVNEQSATRVARELRMLDDRKGGDITLIINSPGGSVSDGMVIYDTIQSLRNDVRTICEGDCSSMGAFLLLSGTPGKRSAAPNALIMIHQPSGGARGQVTDIKRQAENLLYIKRHMTELMSRHTGIAVEDLTAMMERDKTMTAQRALALGIIDRIEPPRKALPPIGMRLVDRNAPDMAP